MQNSMVVFIFFWFRPEILFSDHFNPKTQNCQFKLKFGIKNHNCQFKLKFSTYINWNLKNLVVKFIFSVFVRKYPLWSNPIQKIKIVRLTWNLVPRLIQIFRIQRWLSRMFRIQWWYSLFKLLTKNTFFV